MSEEEIIKEIENYENWKVVYNPEGFYQFIPLPKDYKQAIQGLLDLYNKEKEKNKSIEAQRLRDMCYKTDGNYISKDKIIKYENAIETKISSVELDRDYGRYKRYGGKIKCEKYLAQLYGYKKALEELLEEKEI